MRILVWAGLIAGLAAIAIGQSAKKATPAPGAAALPADIDPQSYSRLPIVKREDLDESGKTVYDAVAAPNKTAPTSGPVAISLYSPKVAEAMRLLNDYLRFGGVLGRRNTEVAILVAAREFVGGVQHGREIERALLVLPNGSSASRRLARQLRWPVTPNRIG